MRFAMLIATLAATTLHAQQPFSVRDALSAPYALGLTAAGDRFAWIENAEGVRNIWVAGAHGPARQITAYNNDDAQDITGLAWSPDRSAIAYTLGAEAGASGRAANPAELQRDTTPAVFVQKLDGKTAAVRVGEGRGAVFLDSARVAFVRGGKIFSAGLTEEKDSAAQQLVFDRGSASGLTLSPDGKLLAYASHRRTHSFIGLFDIAAKTLRFVAPSTGNDSAPVFSRDGTQLAWLREPYTDAPEFAANRVSANPWSVMVADVATLTARAVYTPAANAPGSVIPRFATGNPRVWWAAGATLLFCSEADGWVHLYSVDTSPTHRAEKSAMSGAPGLPVDQSVAAPKLLTPFDGEVEDVSVSADGERVYFASNMRFLPMFSGPPQRERAEALAYAADFDRRHLWQIDLQHANTLRALTHGEGIETRPVELQDGSIVALAADARVPMHMVAVGKDGALQDVRKDAAPVRYPGAQFVVPQQVVFASALMAGKPATLQIHAQLFVPQAHVSESRRGAPGSVASAKHPAIVFFHGGPRRQMLLGYPAMGYYSNAYAMNQWFAAHGYVVLSVNYRCGIGYGLAFRQCEHSGADGASEYNDALAAVAYLRTRDDVDARRIGIWGGSYGGYFAALGLARNSDLFAAGVDFHGVHDWTLEDNAASDWLRGTATEKDTIAARARAASPIADVAKWRSPVLLIHGDDDPEVAYAQTPMLADALRARGVHVEELILPDEVHEFLLHRSWVRGYESMAEFFARTLQP
jgi:dipeptidyl aminopeptidase/acylaminoacyl peptidase